MMVQQRESEGSSRGTRGSEVKGARVDDKPTLASAGIDKNLADRARKYAAIPEQKFESILSDRRERIEKENERVRRIPNRGPPKDEPTTQRIKHTKRYVQ
jgi:hypothetical protein